MPLDYEEKRAFPRMHVQCDIELVDPRSGARFSSRCEDLSGGGILFRCDDPLELDQEFEMTMQGGLDTTPPLRARIRILRCEADGDRYEVAARIEEILRD